MKKYDPYMLGVAAIIALALLVYLSIFLFTPGLLDIVPSKNVSKDT